MLNMQIFVLWNQKYMYVMGYGRGKRNGNGLVEWNDQKMMYAVSLPNHQWRKLKMFSAKAKED